MNNKCKLTLVINAGSSSIKYKVFNIVNDGVIASGQCEKIGNIMLPILLLYRKVAFARHLIPRRRNVCKALRVCPL